MIRLELRRYISSFLVCAILTFSLLFTSCEKSSFESGDKEIISFVLKQANNTDFDTSGLLVSIHADTIHITVPPNTNLTQLIPDITIKGVSVSPASGTLVNFSQPVSFTVTAEDGSTKRYAVIVSSHTISSTLYVGSSDNNFYALDALTGTLRWKYTGTNWFSFSSPTFYKGIVYSGCIDGSLYAFDAASGEVRWKYETGGSIESSPAISEGIVYFGSVDNTLYAVDASNGQLRWKYETGANASSSPTIVNDMVYFGSDDNNIYALNKNNGQLKWIYVLGAMPNQSGASVVNGVLYVGSRDGYLYALDASNGHLKWRYYADGISLEQSSPTVVGNRVYVAGWYDMNQFSRAGSLLALNATTGELLWRSLDGLGFSSSPFVDGNRLFLGCDDLNFYAIDASTGGVLWSKRILTNRAGATVANGMVYIGGGGTGYIYAFDETTGIEKWRFAVGSGGLDTSSPCVVTSETEVHHPGISGEMN